jgi:hypothetical protein
MAFLVQPPITLTMSARPFAEPPATTPPPDAPGYQSHAAPSEYSKQYYPRLVDHEVSPVRRVQSAHSDLTVRPDLLCREAQPVLLAEDGYLCYQVDQFETGDPDESAKHQNPSL